MRLSNGLELTAEQESNLRKLALYHLRGIEASPMGFDMASYTDKSDLAKHDDPLCDMDCGTVGCLLGHSQLAGIDVTGCKCWADIDLLYLPVPRDLTVANQQDFDEWFWCFGPEWSDIDNTPEGGAKRILWLLEYGLPDDWKEQGSGCAPLCYADWSPELPAEIVEQVPESVAV